MRSLFYALAEAHRRGEDLVLCSIIESSGSAPRGSGALLVLFQDGSTVGTVGGGAVEFETVRLANKSLRERRSITHRFALSADAAADIGMICGGEVTLHLAPILGGDARFSVLLDALLPQLDCRTNSWLIQRLDGGFDLFIDGRGLLFGSDTEAAMLQPKLLPHAARIEAADGAAYFLLPLTRAQTVYVFGGGHVAHALVPLLTKVGFSVVVAEDRAEFCTKERFPDASETLLCDFSDIGRSIRVTENDLLVIMTRGHQADYEVLRQALGTDAFYIGMIGSRKKIAATNERLLLDGFSEADLSRIHAPIGLPIRADSPEEIAVSIAAELILMRAQNNDAR